MLLLPSPLLPSSLLLSLLVVMGLVRSRSYFGPHLPSPLIAPAKPRGVTRLDNVLRRYLGLMASDDLN